MKNKKVKLILSIVITIAIIIVSLDLMKKFIDKYSYLANPTFEINENNNQNSNQNSNQNNNQNNDTNEDVVEDVYIPSFEAKYLKGENFVLDEHFDKPIVINFWATWCQYCVDEMQYFNTLENKYEDVTFLMIVEADDSEKKLEEIQEYLYKYELDFDFVILDEFSKIAKTYGVPGYPTTLFINKGGILETGYVGPITEEQLEEAILMLK